MKKYKLYLIFSLIFTFVLAGCHFISSFSEDYSDDITLSFDKNKTSVSIGAMEIVNLKASKNQNTASISWSYDSSVIFAKADNYSCVITGLKPGSTTLTASSGSNSVSCLITVSDDSYTVNVTNPYVYASNDYVSVKPNETVRVSAALFGGTASDINGFDWTIDKSSVASLQKEGNYCWITGKNEGIAKVTVKHGKAAYGYSMLVDCSSDGTSQCYITTSENVITINLSESDTAEFAVDLVNPLVTDYASGFEYSVVDSLGNEISSRPVVVTGSGNLNVSLKAYEEGECYVRCHHPQSYYDLDILVRVIAQAETAYIEPSQNLVTVSDTSYESVSLSLLNYAADVNPALYSWSFSDDADEYIEYTIYNGSSELSGDKINIKGKKTGSVKVTVSYPGVPSRSFVVLVRNVTSEASDATCYIATSQNYIRMSPSDSPQQINIILRNASENDIKNLKWTITNDAADGSSSKVINWKSGNGTSKSLFARSVVAESTTAYAIIEPVNVGTAYIDISHPKATYSTRITVVVSPEKAAEEPVSYLNLSSASVVTLKNGENRTVNISFSGSGNSSDIVWSCEGNATVNGNETECVITAPASGSGGSRSTVTATHPYCKYPVKFTVVSYDTEEEFNEFMVKSIYTYKTNETIKTSQKVNLYLETVGFNSGSDISWTVTQGASFVSISTENSNRTCIVEGVKVGTAVIKAEASGCDDVFFTVNVTEEGIIDESKDCYISTSQNVLYFEDINRSLSFSVELFNINESAYSKLTYKLSNGDYEVSANNNYFTVTSLSASSKATLTISHPLSQNVLVINLQTGNQYEFINEDSCYISVNQEVFELYAGQEEVSLVATVNHTEQSDSASVPKGFTFESEDTSIATVSYVNFSNTCYIKPVKNGTTKIFIRHPDADFEKEVVVIVNQSPDASTIPYITTSNNVITAIQGNYVTATVSLVNSDSIDNFDWSWSSLDTRIVDVVANNGTSALLSANSPGTCEVKVTHKKCPYALKLIVTVLDSGVVTNKPYISTNTNIITLKKGMSTTLTASMIGGNGDSDNNYFKFQGSNPSLMLVSSVSGAAYIKGLNTGIGYITVYNTRFNESYSKTVLVIIEDKIEDGVYISISNNVLKLKPTQNTLSTITATLVNGEPTDGKDFIWWADDYNLIGLTSVAEQCSVMPTGRTGTTKIHVKHAKASKQADILVMISNYDTFAFEKTSANISSEKLYFFPLQVPSVEEAFEIKYSSSNENVCIIQGSNAVAWVCGLSYGTASLTASMVTSDGTVLATTEMLVAVTVPEPNVPTISLGNSIITVEAGTSKTFSAVISGEGLDATERFNLKWSVANKDAGLSLLDESPDKTAYGPDVYVTFNHGGEYVLVCEHEKTGAMQQLYIIVEEHGEVLINLNTSLETVYKDDGSFTLTAELTNGTDADYKTISWSAVKVGGQNIVAVSKAKGATCTVTPKSVGQTQVIAKLPNGKTAMCTVIVKANAEISFDTGSIHVIPGYTEVVNYRTNPENATINWITQMTTGSSGLTGNITNYFTVEDDTAKKQLRITGKVDYPGGVAGTVTASMVGASSANLPSLKVYVEYNVELSLYDMSGNLLTLLSNDNPDTANVKYFQVAYYPSDLEIDILKGSSVVACIPSEGNTGHCIPDNVSEISVGNVTREIKVDKKDGLEKVFLTVGIIPHTECNFDLTVRATLPNDTNGTYATKKSFYYSAFYENYDIELIDLTKAGAWTKPGYDAKGKLTSITLGDGEEMVFSLKIKNENAVGFIEELNSKDWTPDPTGRKDAVFCSSGSSLLKKDREDKFTIFFEYCNGNNIQKNISMTPKDGMIYFYPDRANSSSTETVYHLCHLWDYYEDLPMEIQGNDEQGNSKWESYKNAHLYENSFITTLKDKGVKNWLVTREYIWKNTYHAIAHNPSVPTITASWSAWMENDDWWEWFCRHVFRSRGRMQVKFNGTEVYNYRNDGENTTKNLSHINGVRYDICTPYTISTQELLNNSVLVRPDSVSSIPYNKGSGFLFRSWFGDESDSGTKFSKLNHAYLTPTVSKDTTKTIVGNGSLTINYKDGRGKSHSTVITVTVERRDCEAYTNGSWVTETAGGYTHYIMADFVNPGEVPTAPYLNVNSFNIDSTTAEIDSEPSVIYVPYEVYPSSESITVRIPTSQYTGLSLSKGYSSVTQKDGYTEYIIRQHEKISKGEGSGTLYFAVNGAYSGIVEVISSSETKEVNFEIKKEDFYVARINSKVATANNALAAKYSYSDENASMLIVGDGETVSGIFQNIDTSSSTKITSVTYESFTEATTVMQDSQKDLSGKLQKELVNCAANGSDGNYSFTVRHAKDYGYYARNPSDAVTDEFFKTKFLLKDVVIDENSVTYETVYKTVSEVNSNGETVEITVVDEEKTEENRLNAIADARLRKLNENKSSYAAGNAGIAKTSFTMPYYYIKTSVKMENKNYPVTVIGRFVIQTDSDYTQEILVAVKVTDSPCNSSGSYGYEVPSSYYLNVTE